MSRLRRVVNNGQYQRKALCAEVSLFPQNPCSQRLRASLSPTFINDRMAGGRSRTLRNMACLTVFYHGLPDIYPIFYFILLGEKEQLCAESSKTVNTLEAQRRPEASLS